MAYDSSTSANTSYFDDDYGNIANIYLWLEGIQTTAYLQSLQTLIRQIKQSSCGTIKCLMIS